MTLTIELVNLNPSISHSAKAISQPLLSSITPSINGLQLSTSPNLEIPLASRYSRRGISQNLSQSHPHRYLRWKPPKLSSIFAFFNSCYRTEINRRWESDSSPRIWDRMRGDSPRCQFLSPFYELYSLIYLIFLFAYFKADSFLMVWLLVSYAERKILYFFF